MKDNGPWKKMYDKRIHNVVYRKDPNAWRVFDCMLALANTKTGRLQVTERELANILNMQNSTVHRCILRLTGLEMIKLSTAEQNPTGYVEQGVKQQMEQPAEQRKREYQLVKFSEYSMHSGARSGARSGAKYAEQDLHKKGLQDPIIHSPSRTGEERARRLAKAKHLRSRGDNANAKSLAPLTHEDILAMELKKYGDKDLQTVSDDNGNFHQVPSDMLADKTFEWVFHLSSDLLTYRVNGGK